MKNKIKKVIKAILIIILVLFIGVVAFTIKSMIPNKTEKDDTQLEDSTPDYLDIKVSNEHDLYEGVLNNYSISINNSGYNSIMNAIKGIDNAYTYSEYYDLENNIKAYYETMPSEELDTRVLVNGKFDSNALFDIVTNNNAIAGQDKVNAVNIFYSDASDDEIREVCNLITDTLNNSNIIANKERIANILTHLKIFKHETSTANAYVSDSLVLAFNPNMIGLYDQLQILQGKKDEKIDTEISVFIHEIMHIAQYSSGDGNEDNGTEAGGYKEFADGVCNVNSLWDSWLLEGAAEIKMAEYMDTKPIIYEKKISYIASYELSRIFDEGYNLGDFVNTTFAKDLNSVFDILNITSENDKMEFLKFMYSIELTQTDCDDFWNYYQEKTGKTLTDDEKLSIKMEIRRQAIIDLTSKYYEGLVNAIKDGKIKDINTLYFLMREWELDSYNHMVYNKPGSYEAAIGFIKYQDSIQNEIFKAIADATGNSFESIKNEFGNYKAYSTDGNSTFENFNIDFLSSGKKDKSITLFNNYNSVHFVQNQVMIDYIQGNTNN